MRLLSPPPLLMHSTYAAAAPLCVSSPVASGVDDAKLPVQKKSKVEKEAVRGLRAPSRSTAVHARRKSRTGPKAFAALTPPIELAGWEERQAGFAINLGVRAEAIKRLSQQRIACLWLYVALRDALDAHTPRTRDKAATTFFAHVRRTPWTRPFETSSSVAAVYQAAQAGRRAFYHEVRQLCGQFVFDAYEGRLGPLPWPAGIHPDLPVIDPPLCQLPPFAQPICHPLPLLGGEGHF